MKNFKGVIKKNLFYISLITGMAALVAIVGIYNTKSNSNHDNKKVETTETQNEKNQKTENSKDTGKEANEAEVDSSDNGESEKKETKEVISGYAKAEKNKASEKAQNSKTLEALVFDESQGISWPKEGNVIIPFSMDTTVYFESLNEYKCNPAMVIEAQLGDQVKAVCKGRVIESSTSPELGNYMKMDIGSGYTVTYGQLSDVKVAVGSTCEMGDIIGLVGEPSRYYSEEGCNLYFAIEKDGKPVDPTLLIE